MNYYFIKTTRKNQFTIKNPTADHYQTAAGIYIVAVSKKVVEAWADFNRIQYKSIREF